MTLVPKYMTLVPRKIRRKNREYWELVDEKRVNGKTIQKYVGYIGKSLNSRNEIDPEEIMKYVRRLLRKGITQGEIGTILKSIGMEYDAWSIIKIITSDLSPLMLYRFQ